MRAAQYFRGHQLLQFCWSKFTTSENVLVLASFAAGYALEESYRLEDGNGIGEFRLDKLFLSRVAGRCCTFRFKRLVRRLNISGLNLIGQVWQPPPRSTLELVS